MEDILRLAGQKPRSWEKVQLNGDGENLFVTVKCQAKNHLEHWLQKKSTAQNVVGAIGKVTIAAYTDKAADTGMEKKIVDCWVWLSEKKTNIHQSVIESDKKSDFQVVDMAEKTVANAMKMCVVEEQHGTGRSKRSLVIWKVAGDVLEKGVVAWQMQMATIRAIVLFDYDQNPYWRAAGETKIYDPYC